MSYALVVAALYRPDAFSRQASLSRPFPCCPSCHHMTRGALCLGRVYEHVGTETLATRFWLLEDHDRRFLCCFYRKLIVCSLRRRFCCTQYHIISSVRCCCAINRSLLSGCATTAVTLYEMVRFPYAARLPVLLAATTPNRLFSRLNA